MSESLASDWSTEVSRIETFLDSKRDQNLIAGFRTQIFPSVAELKNEWGPTPLLEKCRTHKLIPSVGLLVFEINKNSSVSTGIDLEPTSVVSWPVFQKVGFL